MNPRSVLCSVLVAAPLIVVLLVGCTGGSNLSWTEDVKVPDGRVIALERYTEFKGGSSHLGDPSTESLQRFKFSHPTTGELVKWEDSEFPGRLKTIALWFDGEVPVLLTTPAYGGDFITFKCPNPPYFVYEYVQGHWRSKPLAKIGVDRLRSNMTTHSLEQRQYIEGYKRRLSAGQTADSYTYRDGTQRVPYIIEFKGMPEQTFRVYENCNRPLNYLLQ